MYQEDRVYFLILKIIIDTVVRYPTSQTKMLAAVLLPAVLYVFMSVMNSRNNVTNVYHTKHEKHFQLINLNFEKKCC